MENPSAIATEVGLTALIVAALRAVETSRDDPLIRDPLAARFVRGANTPTPLPTSLDHVDHVDQVDQGKRQALLGFAADGVALRTRYLDDYLTGAAATQVVILAAGLDTRAFRLDWPRRCTVFELDQAPVLEFKQSALDRAGARPGCDRRAVAVDLRDGWAAALDDAGFDPARPTAWLIEGLLPYLSPGQEEDLFDLVHARSAGGSSMAVWAMAQDARAADRRLSGMYSAFGVDIEDVTNTEPRRNAVEHLLSLGWAVTAATLADLAGRYGRPLSSSRRRISIFTARYPV
jgi:methyltransferase (TIGR00027 family)